MNYDTYNDIINQSETLDEFLNQLRFETFENFFDFSDFTNAVTWRKSRSTLAEKFLQTDAATIKFVNFMIKRKLDVNGFADATHDWRYMHIFFRESSPKVINHILKYIADINIPTVSQSWHPLQLLVHNMTSYKKELDPEYIKVIKKVLGMGVYFKTKRMEQGFIRKLYELSKWSDLSSLMTIFLADRNMSQIFIDPLNIEFMMANEMMDFFPDSIKDVFIF